MTFTTKAWTCNESDPEVWECYELKVPTLNIDLIPFKVIDAELAQILDLGEPLEVNNPTREETRIIPVVPEKPTQLKYERARIGYFTPYRGEDYVIAICEFEPKFNPFETAEVA